MGTTLMAPKMNQRVGAVAVINHHLQNVETTCRHLSKNLPDNSPIFASGARAIILAMNYYLHMGPFHHDVIINSDSMSCLQATEGEDTENPFVITLTSWLLSYLGTRIRFCWIPSDCRIEGKERVNKLVKETIDHDIDPTGGCPLRRFVAIDRLLCPTMFKSITATLSWQFIWMT